MSNKVKVRILTTARKEQGTDEALSPNFTRILSAEKVTGLAIVVKEGNTRVIEGLAKTSRTPIRVYRFGTPSEFRDEYRRKDGVLRGEGYLVCITDDLNKAERILKYLPSGITQLDTQF
ncbi:MAG TPA: hypothetical protein VHA12_03365 [Candidatus Nanoarchaeia archaeon]|nr:hypothetical protein [Candidatus Nanoarchaeia archaeon]